MKASTSFVCFALWTLPALAGNSKVTLTYEKIASLRPAGKVTKQAFAERWGQFEVRIPKEHFPIAAPNCSKDVILRSIGIDPNAADKEKKLALQWALYQSLRNIVHDNAGSVEVSIAPGPYMQKDKAGAPVLEYCNAYINAATAAQAKPTLSDEPR